MSASPHVYFEGNWSEGEITIVEAAAEEADRLIHQDMYGIQAPWVAVCHRTGDEKMYVASRYGSSRVYSGQSAVELANEIRAFASCQ